MKKFFTLSVLCALIGTAFGQYNLSGKSAIEVTGNHRMVLPPNLPTGASRMHHSGSRSGTSDTVAFALDYSNVDALYAQLNGFDYYYVGDISMNTRYANTDNFTTKFGAVLYDSLILVDNTNQTTSYIPRASAQLNLDSFEVYLIHTRAVGNNVPDSIHFTVFNRNTANITGTGPTATFTVTPLWDTMIITSTQLPLTVNSTFADLMFYPNLSFAQGETFGIMMQSSGDTANKVILPAGFRDECAGACAAEPTVAGMNSYWYFNYTTTGGTNISGINSIGLDCNGDGTVGTPGACEEFYLQNYYIFSYVTAQVQYGVAIAADSLKGCPGGSLNLTANAYGSANSPFTYAWSATSGTLSSTTDQQVTYTIGSSNATITCTVTDANNNTTTSSVVVQSKGINISITNTPTPVQINCGSTATLTTQVSGTTAGKNYTWSTGATGSTQTNIQVNAPGTYTVTVTNNSGCSSTASVSVEYPGGLSNSVTFNVPNPVCAGTAATFTNTSSGITGWNYTWDFGDTHLFYAQNGVNTYANPGVYAVTLSEDSAGCTFTSAPHNVTVLAATNAACINSIEDVTFNSAISLMPNPTKGSVTITVNAVETNVSVKVFNVIGSEVMSYTTNVNGTSFTKAFDLSSLASGTYLVKIQSGDKVAVKKLTMSK